MAAITSSLSAAMPVYPADSSTDWRTASSIACRCGGMSAFVVNVVTITIIAKSTAANRAAAGRLWFRCANVNVIDTRNRRPALGFVPDRRCVRAILDTGRGAIGDGHTEAEGIVGGPARFRNFQHARVIKRVQSRIEIGVGPHGAQL